MLWKSSIRQLIDLFDSRVSRGCHSRCEKSVSGREPMLHTFCRESDSQVSVLALPAICRAVLWKSQAPAPMTARPPNRVVGRM